MFVCSYLSYNKIQNSENNELRKKFGSFFTEFKNDKRFLSSKFYFVYFSRRLTHVITQVYLNGFPYIQSGISIGFTIVQLVFLGYYRPFKEFSILLSNFFGECVFIVFVICAFFIGDLSACVSQTLKTIVIFSVFGGMDTQFIISVYTLSVALKTIWLKIQKYRAASILKMIRSSGSN